MTLRAPELRRVEVEIDRLTLAPPDATGAREGKVLRFAHIVVAVDGSAGAEHALEWTAWTASREKAQVHLVSALGPPPYSYDRAEAPPLPGSVSSWRQLMDEERRDAEAVLESARARLAKAGVEATVEVAIGSPAKVVSAIAESRRADLVICGSHGGGTLERLVLGSVADGLKHQAHCSVLIAKQPPVAKAVLLPTDGSELSRSAVLTGARIAGELATEARLLHVVRGRADLSRRGYEEAVRAAEESGRAREVSGKLPQHIGSEVAFGEPARLIIEHAERLDAGLIVMGSRGLGGLAGRMLGSVSNQVSHHVKASVLFLKPQS